jgi:Tfp pilus assembly protein PilX
MFKPRIDKKGVALMMVLVILLVVVILANVLLTIITSQARLTHHQVSRLRAYYVAQAGMNLALENLRTGAWTAPGTYQLCRSGCTPPNVTDSEMPYNVTIAIGNQIIDPSNPLRGTYPINLTVNYTYTP